MATRQTSRRRARPKSATGSAPAAEARLQARGGTRKRATSRQAGRSAAGAKPSVPAAAPRTLPDIEVEVTGGRRLRLADLKGRNVVIYFYPKDDTPGCTAEGCAIRDRYADFQRYDAVVLGVSRDGLASHERFKAKYGFPFELVSDADERLCRLFGVIREKTLYGRKHLGVERSTFLYDRRGVLHREFRGVKVNGHAEELLAELAGLQES